MARVAAPIHRLALFDGRRVGGLLIDLASGAGGQGAGYALLPNTHAISQPTERVLADPASFARDGMKPRASSFDNRMIEFTLSMKGVSQTNVHGLLRNLSQMASRARDWSYKRIGNQPLYRWKAAKHGRAMYGAVQRIEIVTPTSYGNLDLTANRIDNVHIRIQCDPLLDEYRRPVFCANGYNNAGDRVSGIFPTEGYALSGNDYLFTDWVPWIGSGATGQVLIWFRADWDDTDHTRRSIVTFRRNAARVFEIYRDTTGAYTIWIEGSGVLTCSQATVRGAWYGISCEWGVNGFNGYFMQDGVALDVGAGAATPFNGNVNNNAWGMAGVPDHIRIGLDVADTNRLNTGVPQAEVDSFIYTQQPGFEIPTHPWDLPFTRDIGSLMAYAGHFVYQSIDPNTVSVQNPGDLHVLFRKVPGDASGKLWMRLRSQSNNLAKLRVFNTSHRIGSNGNQVVFSNSAGLGGIGGVGTGWSATTDPNALDSFGSMVVSTSGPTSITDPTLPYAYTKTITVPVDREVNGWSPTSYIVLLRCYNSYIPPTQANDQRYRVDFVNAPIRISSGIVTLHPTTAAWRIIPMMVVNLPLSGARPGGAFSFSYEIYAEKATGATLYVDGLFFVPVVEGNAPLQAGLTAPLQNTEEIQAFQGLSDLLFRVNQAAQTDVAPSMLQEIALPRLIPFSNNRMYFLVDGWAGTSTEPTNHQKTSAVGVNLPTTFDFVYVPSDVVAS